MEFRFNMADWLAKLHKVPHAQTDLKAAEEVFRSKMPRPTKVAEEVGHLEKAIAGAKANLECLADCELAAEPFRKALEQLEDKSSQCGNIEGKVTA